MQRALTGKDFKTLSLAALGGALEYYDFIAFVFFAAVIGKLFFPPDTPDWLQLLQTFGIFAAGYLIRPLGGIVMAHFGDLFGRKRMFTLGIFMMSVPTLLTGLLPTYESIGVLAPIALLVLRMVQGAAVGGEVPGAWVFVSEHVPPRHVGFACGTLTSGLTTGILLGSLVAAGINTWYTPAEVADFAWRIPFIVGGVLGLFGVYLRSYLEETPVFEEMQRNRTLARELPLKTVARDHRPAIVVAFFLTWLLTAGIVVVTLMTPTLIQKQYGIPAQTALQASSLATLCLTFGCTAFGAFIDRFGSGVTFVGGSIALLASSLWFYVGLDRGGDNLFLAYAVTGFCVGIAGAVPYAIVSAFPASIRYSGLSSSYNIAYAIFGGLTPVLVTYAMKDTPLAPAYYVGAVCVVGVLTGLYLLGPGRKLNLLECGV